MGDSLSHFDDLLVLPRFQGFSPSLFLKRVKRAAGNLVKEY